MVSVHNSGNQSQQERDALRMAPVTHSSTDIELVKIIYSVLDKLYLLVIAALICGLAVAGYAKKNSTVRYTAVSKAFLVQNVDGVKTLGMLDFQVGEVLKADYIAAFQNRHVHEEVLRRLGLPYTPEQLGSMISASYSEESHVIQVNCRGFDPQETVLIANTYVEVATYFFRELIQNDVAAIWETAERAYPYETMPVSTYFRYGIFGGAVLMLLVVVLLAVFDDRIRVPDDIEKTLAIPVLGALTLQKTKKKKLRGTPILLNLGEEEIPYAHIEDLNLPNQGGQDMLSTIAANLQFSVHHKNVIAVTSCTNRDGKSYIALQLARTIAETGKKVVVVDTNFRRSSLRKDFAIHMNNVALNLEDGMTGLKDLDNCICWTNVENLDMVLCRSGNSDPVSLLTNPRFVDLIQLLSEEYDLVLLDTPSAGQTADAVRTIHYCDGVILVAGYGHTKRGHIKDVMKKIGITGCPIVGAVINKVKFDCLNAKKTYWILRYKY